MWIWQNTICFWLILLGSILLDQYLLKVDTNCWICWYKLILMSASLCEEYFLVIQDIMFSTILKNAVILRILMCYIEAYIYLSVNEFMVGLSEIMTCCHFNNYLWFHLFLAVISIFCNIFSCDQAALWMVQSVCLSVCPSVRPSVCLSHLFDYVPIILSSWNFQELLPVTKVSSVQKVKVRGQRSRSQRSQPNLTVSGL